MKILALVSSCRKKGNTARIVQMIQAHMAHMETLAAHLNELFQAIAQQRFLRPSFLSLLIFKVQQQVWKQEMPGSVDYAYWQDQGWLDPTRDYYIEHQVGRPKVALA